MKGKNNIATVNITIGMQLGITVAIFVYAGYRADLYLDKTPIFLSIGAFLGMIIGFYHLLKELGRMNDQKQKNKNGKNIHWN